MLSQQQQGLRARVRLIGRYAAVSILALLLAASVSAAGVRATKQSTLPRIVTSAAGSGVSTASIGADGPQFTQVQLVHAQEFSGNGIKVGLYDPSGGVDFINTPVFGGCDNIASPEDTCRVVAGYNAQNPNELPLPSGPGDQRSTLAAGICCGQFPDKLFLADGNEVPYQTGVAPWAKLGVYRVSNVDDLGRGIQDGMDIIMSYGSGSAWTEMLDKYEEFGPKTIVVTPAGDIAQEGLWALRASSASQEVISVASVKNTVLVGAHIKLNRAIKIKGRDTDVIDAPLRLDASGSIASPTIEGRPDMLPQALTVITGGCNKLADVDESTINRVILTDCNPFEGDNFKTAAGKSYKQHAQAATMILLTTPGKQQVTLTDASNSGVPMFWIEDATAQAIIAGLAPADDYEEPLAVTQLAGAFLKEDATGQQPMDATGWSLTRNLQLKPDLAAPGNLYSSSTNGAYTTNAIGTDLATAYVSGALALWKEAMLYWEVPVDDWTAAAKAAFKLTAKPVPYAAKKGLYWPPARMGAGIIQVNNAILNQVTVTPHEVLVPSGVKPFTQTFTITNTLENAVSYKLFHLPGVAITLEGNWGANFLAPDAPTASVTVKPGTINVPAGKSLKFTVTMNPSKLAAKPYLYSGYLQLKSSSKGAFTLSIAYQGVSKAFEDPTQVPLLFSDAVLPEQLKGLQGGACLATYTGDTVMAPRTCASVTNNGGQDGYDYTPTEPQKPSVSVDLNYFRSNKYTMCVPIANARPIAAASVLIYKYNNNNKLNQSPWLPKTNLEVTSGITKGSGVPCAWFKCPEGSTSSCLSAGKYVFKVSVFPEVAAADAGKGGVAQTFDSVDIQMY